MIYATCLPRTWTVSSDVPSATSRHHPHLRTTIRSDLAAAMQRVREVPKKVAVARKCDVDNPQKLAWYQGWNDAIDAVFRALDGDA